MVKNLRILKVESEDDKFIIPKHLIHYIMVNNYIEPIGIT